MKKVFYVLASSLFLLAAQPSMAQTKKMTLDECIKYSVEHSPQMQLANKSIERAKILQGTAWDVDKTDVTLGQDPTSGGSPDNALSFTQSIEFPTYYMARHGQLKAETKAEKGRAQVVKQDLVSDVKSAYYQLVYEAERLRLLASQDSLLRRYKDLAQKRYEAGEAKQLEVLTAEQMMRENNMEMVAAQSEAEGVRQKLCGLMGIDTTIEPVETTLSPTDWVQQGYNYAMTPEGQYAQDRMLVADKAVKVAKNGYAPSLSLSLRSQLVITSWDPYHQNRSRFDQGNFMGFEVGVGVPLFFGATRAKVKAANRDREIVQLEMQQEQQQRQQEYNACLSRLNAARVRLEYYQQEGGQKAAEMERISCTEYEQGESNYHDLITTLQNCIDMRMKRATAINDYNQSVVSMQRICGM